MSYTFPNQYLAVGVGWISEAPSDMGLDICILLEGAYGFSNLQSLI